MSCERVPASCSEGSRSGLAALDPRSVERRGCSAPVAEPSLHRRPSALPPLASHHCIFSHLGLTVQDIQNRTAQRRGYGAEDSDRRCACFSSIRCSRLRVYRSFTGRDPLAGHFRYRCRAHQSP